MWSFILDCCITNFCYSYLNSIRIRYNLIHIWKLFYNTILMLNIENRSCWSINWNIAYCFWLNYYRIIWLCTTFIGLYNYNSKLFFQTKSNHFKWTNCLHKFWYLYFISCVWTCIYNNIFASWISDSINMDFNSYYGTWIDISWIFIKHDCLHFILYSLKWLRQYESSLLLS